MFTLVVGQTQFSITAEDAATYLNTMQSETQRPPFTSREGAHIGFAYGQTVVIGPAMLTKADTLRMLRDNGYRH